MTSGFVKRLCRALAGTLIALLGGAAWCCPSGSEVSRDQVWLFPSASEPLREGLVRVVNRSVWAGEVRIVPIDGGGRVFDTLSLTLDAHETVHIGSADLESGNPDKGLSGGAGAGEGAWRLVFSSELDIEVLSFIRTRDGMLSAMHDIVLGRDDGCRVAILHFGTDLQLTGILRLINLGAKQATFTIRGTEEGSGPAQGEVTLAIDAYAARSVTARELASGAPGLEGMLGNGPDLRELVLESDGPFAAMSLVRSASGHLTNLSSLPSASADGVHRVPLLPASGNRAGRLGLVHVINRSRNAGEVRIRAYDDMGRAYGPLTLSIDGNEPVRFDSGELEQGGLGALPTGTGSGEGDWHLELTSDLEIEVLAHVRNRDGLVTSTHDTSERTGNLHRTAVFAPGDEFDPAGGLRLVNDGAERATVAIRRADGGDPSSGNAVEIPMPGHAARAVGAVELMSVLGSDGARGDGPASRQLVIESEQPLLAMSLLESRSGHLANLSASAPRWDPVLSDDHFEEIARGRVGGIPVGVVDGEGFEPGTHGQRIVDFFFANTDHASLWEIRGWCTYRLHGIAMGGSNICGHIRHTLRHGTGIFFTATDGSPLYRPGRNGWFIANGRPFTHEARTFARWAQGENVLMVSSTENPTGSRTPEGGFEPVYCDDFDSGAGEWIPLCGELDDYIAHSGTGLDKVIFVGALTGPGFSIAAAAIRADGVFAPHTIYVHSRDGSSSQATPVLAAYAVNLALANPAWDAARLKRELLTLARTETLEHFSAAVNPLGTMQTERRTVRVIRPGFAPAAAGGGRILD